MATEKTGLYGMWSVAQKRFIFGIQEPSKNKARKALESEIGPFDHWRFKPKEIVEGHAMFLGEGLGKALKVGENK